MRNLSVHIRRGNLVKLNKDSIASFGLIALLLGLTLYPLVNPQKANAAVTQSFVRFDRMGTGESISGTACLNTSTSGTETNVVIVFPTDWTIDSTTGGSNWTVSTTNLPAGSSAWPSIAQATSINGNSVVFPGADLSTGTLYCFHFDDTVATVSTIGAAGNNKTGQLKTQGGSPYVDTVDWATSVVSADADQITVTASVSATMTFSLSGNSVSLGTINPNTTTAGSAITQSVSTNARNGWISWVKSNTDGGGGVGGAGALASTVASPAQIDSPGSFGGGVETLTTTGGYVLDVNSGNGSPTIATEYDATGGSEADQGGHITYGVFRQTASAADAADNDQVALVVKARSSATTPAANDYTDTLTVVAAGSF